MTEEEMIGWHHRLDGHEFEQAPTDLVMDREAWSAAVHAVTKSRPSSHLILCSPLVLLPPIPPSIS